MASHYDNVGAAPPAVAMQENAWNKIKDVDWVDGEEHRCPECSGAVEPIKTAPLPEGRKRWACVACMQRFNVRLIAPPGAAYGDTFGSF